jgi:hypothetical protein
MNRPKNWKHPAGRRRQRISHGFLYSRRLQGLGIEFNDAREVYRDSWFRLTGNCVENLGWCRRRGEFIQPRASGATARGEWVAELIAGSATVVETRMLPAPGRPAGLCAWCSRSAARFAPRGLGRVDRHAIRYRLPSTAPPGDHAGNDGL